EFLSGDKVWLEVIHPEDLDYYHKHIAKLNYVDMLHMQYRIIHSSGEIRWVEDNIFPTFNDEGQFARLDGIVQDISERKRNEETIHYYAYHDYLTHLPNR